jgi:D-glycero-D-manno-heptose 1,7-bisphosphate phosphatase
MAESWRDNLAEPGLWVQVFGDPLHWRSRPALFMDRDGTINIDTGYPSQPSDITLIEETLPLIRLANARNMAVVVVTNQSGVGRGYFGWRDFAAVNQRLIELLSQAGCAVAVVLACAYHAEGIEPYRVADHPMRKPAPGMLLLAAERLELDLSRSIMVGDRDDDIQAGKNAGVAHAFRIDRDEIAAIRRAIETTA